MRTPKVIAPITQQEFKRTEGKLYAYYRSLHQIDILQDEITVLEKHIKELQQERKDGLTLESDLASPSMSEKVQTSNQSSPQENALMRADRELLIEINVDRDKLQSKRKSKRKAEEEIVQMGRIIKLQSEEDKRFLELRYDPKGYHTNSLDLIAEELHTSTQTESIRRAKLINVIAKLLE